MSYSLPSSWLNHQELNKKWILYDENKYNDHYHTLKSSQYIDNCQQKIFFFNSFKEKYSLSFITLETIYQCIEKSNGIHIKFGNNHIQQQTAIKCKHNFDDISSNWLFLHKFYDINSSHSLTVRSAKDKWHIQNIYAMGFATKKDALIRDKSFIYYLQKPNDLCCYGYIREFVTQSKKYIPDCILALIHCYYSNNLPNLYIENFYNHKRYIFILPIIDTGTIPPIDVTYYLQLLNTNKLNKLDKNLSLSLYKRIIQFMHPKDNNTIQFLLELFEKDKITPSQELGDFIQIYHPLLSAKIYRILGLVYKTIQSYVICNKYQLIINYICITLPENRMKVMCMIYNNKSDASINTFLALYKNGYLE
eukprot:232127_1